MTETPRMVILPAEPDCETVRTLRQWRDAGWKLGAPTERDMYSGVVSASPNAGKISRATLREAYRAGHLAGLVALSNLPRTATADEQQAAYERAEEDAFAAALGFQVAEDQEND